MACGKNFKGNSPNVLRFIESGGSDFSLDGLLSENLAAGAKLAAKNRSEALDEKTARTYELRLMKLEKFAEENGDDAVLFGHGKRPFLAATIQTFLRKYFTFCMLLNQNQSKSHIYQFIVNVFFSLLSTGKEM